MRRWTKLWQLAILTLTYLVPHWAGAQYIWAPLHIENTSRTVPGGRSLLARKRDHLGNFLEEWGIENIPEMKPDNSDKSKFFKPNTESVVHSHDAHTRAKERWKNKQLADKQKYAGEGDEEFTGTPLPADEDEREHFLEPPPADDEAEADSNEELPVGAYVRKRPPKPKRAVATVKKRAVHTRQTGGGQQNVADASSMEGCKIFILDLSEIAKKEGIPECFIDRYVAHPLTQRLLPDPLKSDPTTSHELSHPPDTLEWTFPFTTWSHNLSQHAAPWYLQESIKSNSALYTTNISEATVVFVDDYCYLTWAIADLQARGHWWLDTHKHYKSDFKAGQHLLDVYHAMAHESVFMQKQARNFLFATPLTSFDFGDWQTMDDYVAMTCEHFSNSMHVVFDQVQRWRCGRYRPDRTLVAPLSVTDNVDAPPLDAERELTFVFRGNCDPEGGKEPHYAGKRLRRQLVKLFSKSGDDVSVSCTNEDKTGHGPDAVDDHHLLAHVEYLKEMGRSKFCIMIPGETQNTPRLTEAFLAGCVPVFIGPPWHAMPFPEVVDWRAAAITVHMSDISRWANFGAKWVLERNAPRDVGRLHPKWWTPQVSAKDMDELHALPDLIDFLRDYPEELYQQKKAAVYKYRSFFQWSSKQSSPPEAADITLQRVCSWGQEESKVKHLDLDSRR